MIVWIQQLMYIIYNYYTLRLNNKNDFINLNRWYHSSSSRTNLINSWTGLIKFALFAVLYSFITSSIRSNNKNGSNSSRWRRSAPVTVPITCPDIFPALASAAFDFFFPLDLDPLSCWNTDRVIDDIGSRVSCRPLNTLPSSVDWTSYIMSSLPFNIVAAAPTMFITRSISELVMHGGYKIMISIISFITHIKYYSILLQNTTNCFHLPKNKRRMPRRTWISIPWSIWCNESRMYIWKIQKFISDPACAYVPYIHTTYALLYVVCM